MQLADHLPPAFDALWARALRAGDAGRFEDAVALFTEASDWARAHGDQHLVDLAVARRAGILIEDGRGQDEVSLLREILLRSVDPAVCRSAAYNLARWYELSKQYKKALFYARLARERAEITDQSELLAMSHNQLGNLLLAESKVEAACAEYEHALALMPPEPTPARARILDNLGYCRALNARYPQAFALLYESLRILRRQGAERYQISTLLDLCYAHLEVRRYGTARRHGEAALALARTHGDRDSVKNAYYLLGETANLAGNTFAARRYFLKLQQEFFPDQAYLPGFLLAVDVRKLINLHA